MKTPPLGRTIIATLAIFCLSQSAAAQSFFETHCGRTIENLFCAQGQYDPNGECDPLAKKFEWAVDEFDQAIEQSPPFIQDLSCQLASIRIVDEKQGLEHFAAAYSLGTIVIFTETLEFMKHGDSLRAPGTFQYIFDDSHFEEIIEDTSFSIRFAEKVDLKSFRFRQLFFHEFAHYVDKTLLTFGDAHCAIRQPSYEELLTELGFQHTNAPDAYCDYQIAAARTSEIVSKLEMAGIASPYGACKESEDFAERFSHFVLHDSFDYNFHIYEEDDLLFSQKRFLDRPALKNQIRFLRTLFGVDVSTPQHKNQLMLDHMMCTGPFSKG